YQNFVPGAVNATRTLVSLTAYNNATARGNLFNQTDVTFEANSGAWHHTLLAGAELGRQLTDNVRNTGFFSDSPTSISVPLADPLTTTPVTFRQSATDAYNHLKTDLAAAYFQDQIAITHHFQAILGLRFDSFALQYRNRRNDDYLGRHDNIVSPRA